MIDADSRGRGMPRPYNTAEVANFCDMRDSVFYSPPNGDGSLWWSRYPAFLTPTEFRHTGLNSLPTNGGFLRYLPMFKQKVGLKKREYYRLYGMFPRWSYAPPSTFIRSRA